MFSPRERAFMARTSEKALLQELAASMDELRELLRWWRARQQFVERAADPRWDTALHSYHILKPYITMIKRQAECECTTQTEIINRALQQFFAGSETEDNCHR
jgi:hypothetical protein